MSRFEIETVDGISIQLYTLEQGKINLFRLFSILGISFGAGVMFSFFALSKPLSDGGITPIVCGLVFTLAGAIIGGIFLRLATEYVPTYEIFSTVASVTVEKSISSEQNAKNVCEAIKEVKDKIKKAKAAQKLRDEDLQNIIKLCEDKSNETISRM